MLCRRAPTVFVLLLAASAAQAQALREVNRDSLVGPDGAADVDRAAQLIVEQTNEFRRAQKLEPVEPNDELTDAAEYFADFMARTDEYGHEADGQQPAGRAAEYGYEYCIVSENIAFQFSSAGFESEGLARKFVAGWTESEGHRKNMLDPDVTQTGVAVAHSEESGRYYAVQMFGRPKSLLFEFRVVNESPVTVSYRVGDETFELPPRYTRTHQRCRSDEIVFLTPNGVEGPKFRPDRGDTFRLQPNGTGGYRVAAED